MYDNLIHISSNHVAIIGELLPKIKKIKGYYIYWSDRTNPRYTRKMAM